jgi:hypothetical protein
MASTLQRLFQRHFSQLADTERLPPHWYRAANKLSRCRTAALGGHVQACPEGHVERVWYNSCKHRSCPQCKGLQMARWLQQQRERLLHCPHHHIIFTIPHELNTLWQLNTAAMMELLFQCASQCLQELLNDKRRLAGAEPGYLLALHTWGRSLSLHPHLHCLITDGGLSDSGWQHPKGSCLLPARVLMAKFRGKLLALVRRAIERQTLRLPDDVSHERMHSCLNHLFRKKWNVRIETRYDHGQGLVQYLARYVRGGPLHDGQIRLTNAQQVNFTYTPHRDSATAYRSVCAAHTPEGFLKLVLQHVPEPGKHTVRSYGLYAPRKTIRLNLARTVFRQAPITKIAPLTWQAYYAQHVRQATAHVCAVCGASIGHVRNIAPHHDPPRPRPQGDRHV